MNELSTARVKVTIEPHKAYPNCKFRVGIHYGTTPGEYAQYLSDLQSAMNLGRGLASALYEYQTDPSLP